MIKSGKEMNRRFGTIALVLYTIALILPAIYTSRSDLPSHFYGIQILFIGAAQLIVFSKAGFCWVANIFMIHAILCFILGQRPRLSCGLAAALSLASLGVSSFPAPPGPDALITQHGAGYFVWISLGCYFLILLIAPPYEQREME